MGVKQFFKVFFFIFGTFAFVVVFFSTFLFSLENPNSKEVPSEGIITGGDVSTDFVQFTSAEDYKNYLAEASSLSNNYYGGGMMRTMGILDSVAMPETMSTDDSLFLEQGAPKADSRVSETNVQVIGIDEPDIVKTDGTNIFVTGIYDRVQYLREDIEVQELQVAEDQMFKEKLLVESTSPEGKPYQYYQRVNTTKVVNAFPPEDLNIESIIPEGGELLLSDKNLVVLDGGMIYGYDVSDPTAPSEKWSVTVGKGSNIQRARLYGGTVYIVTNTNIDHRLPCPIPLYEVGGVSMEVRCTDMYHPMVPVEVNTTYTVSSLNPETGEIIIGTSFVGSYDSQFYMSEKSMYITYSHQGDMVQLFYGFTKENTDMFSDEIITKLQKLASYDISDAAKQVELTQIMKSFSAGLNEDEYLRMENEFQDRIDTYMKDHKRDLKITDIVKIAIDDFEVLATGVIPGRLLNQFSMDEYEGNLRVAVTVGEQVWGGVLGMGSQVESANDVYVLDSDLDIIGSALDMGEDERIYSVRFIADKGYVVTFKQTDPFYVLDLSNPKKPEIKGELKIPGYSSYLHPISDDLILGVGKEDSNVKVSLFDVSDMNNPKEADKYELKEYWSEILNTHHAFLLDKKHGVFFIPGNQGGYVFSYADDDIKMIKAVSNINAKRALYIDDYLYVIGSDKIIVLDENTWERVEELEIGGDY